ncbi:MAG: DUF433 domain-containing protein [Bryobacterales bacterium]|nr:DUF433 domain-containing protein [Bryobacterales bacterium]
MSLGIVADSTVLGGKPCIRGTRLSVEFILELIASGANREEILSAYPQIEPEHIEAAVRYAARFLKNEADFEVEVPR